ncbi:hypothetical protein [Neptunitalea lumnitzerae]|nr:hypothetical protein [Neptunitalea sp. Y10]
MKKLNIFSKFLIAGLVAVSTFSCNDEHDFSLNEKPVVSNTGETTLTITEGSEATIELAVSQSIASSIFVLFKPATDDFDFTSDFVIGEGEFIEDYHTGGPEGYVVEIPAYSDTFSVPVEAILDVVPEGSESFDMVMSSYYTRMGTVEGETITYTINVEDYIVNDLDIEFSWDGTYTDADGDTQDLCDIDFDLELYDASFNIIDYSYSSCPEGLYITEGELADGTYYLVPSLWSTNDATFASPMDFPAMLTVTKVNQTQTTLDLSDVWNSTDGGYVEGNSGYQYVYLLTISGSNYTLTDGMTGDVVFNAKVANFLEGHAKRKAALSKK